MRLAEESTTTTLAAADGILIVQNGQIEKISKADLLAALGLLKYFNVKDYGAVGDGSTNDTTAIQAAVTACYNAGGGTVYFPNGKYVGTITLPLDAYANSGSNRHITLLGETIPNYYSNPLVDGDTVGTPPDTGVILLQPTGSTAPVISAATEAVHWGNFTFLGVRLENLTVRTRSKTNGVDVAPSTIAVNGAGMAYLQLENLRCDTESNMSQTVQPLSTSKGVVMPELSNFVFSSINNLLVAGYYDGLVANEHTNGDNIFIDGCYNGIVVETTRPYQIAHGIHFNRVCIARSVNNLVLRDNCSISIQQLALEDKMTTGSWFTNQYDLIEVAPGCQGRLYFNRVESGNSTPVNTLFRRSGTENIVANQISGQYVSGTALTPSTGFPINSALAYWRMEETSGAFIDASGNLRNLTRVGTVTTGTGKVNSAALQTGIGNGLSGGAAGLSPTTAFTLAGWFKLNNTAAAYQVLFQKGTGATLEYTCYYDKASARIVFNMTTNGTTLGTTLVNYTAVGSWVFVLAKWDGATQSLQLNNGTAATLARTQAYAGSGTFVLGNNPEYNSGVDGGMDEVGVWARALSVAEGDYLYNGGAGRTRP